MKRLLLLLALLPAWALAQPAWKPERPVELIIGAAPAVIFGGACAVAASVLWMRLFPALRDRDRIAG